VLPVTSGRETRVSQPKAAIFDLDGVLWRGDAPIEGAAETVAELRRRGLRIGFCTNNSTRHRRDVAAKLRSVGFPANEEDVLTAGALAAEIVAARHPGVAAYVIGEAGLADELAEAGVPVTSDYGVAGVVVVGWDRAISFEKLRAAHRAIVGGAAFFATNPDPRFPEEDGGSAPGCGALTVALERSTGVTAECHGKPSPSLFLSFARAWGVEPADVHCVGDQLVTDIAAANRFGGTSVLVLTGVTTRGAAEAAVGESRPDVVLESVAELPGSLGVA